MDINGWLLTAVAFEQPLDAAQELFRRIGLLDKLTAFDKQRSCPVAQVTRQPRVWASPYCGLVNGNSHSHMRRHLGSWRLSRRSLLEALRSQQFAIVATLEIRCINGYATP